ncbi:MAG: LTA synthase family protein [Lachnospiraceae bacterium]|nr:LTA synthase family protein [Lachnospiraceae bacterium]
MNSEKLTNFLKKLYSQLRLFAAECLILALVLNLCIEAFSRKSVFLPFVYLVKSPLVFVYNTLLIGITLSFSFLFKRRKFTRFIISALWITVGITDFVLLQFRTTPFTAVDLLLLDSAFSIMGHYLSVIQIILIAAAIILVIVIGVILFRKAKKAVAGTSLVHSGVLCALFVFTGIFSTRLFVACGILERNFGNLAQSFHTNGLPYCFFCSIFDTGISKPVSYSKEEVDRIMSSLTSTPPPATVTPPPSSTNAPVPSVPPENTDEPVSYPNFVFLQLESFFDPTYIIGSEYSSDPVPNFRRLKEQCSSGFLVVPSVGAGTANTEFEILTGMNLDFFGPGEYPYKTILKKVPCESLAYNLSALGLSAHAIHNNDGTFYERHKVFSQLGFNTFTPIEYMGVFESTPLGWAKDKMLTKEILKALSSTEGQDFVYTISVQGHGAYPSTEILENPVISVRSLPEELSDSYYGLLYFVNQIYEMDLFLGELIEALENYEEEVVLVLYGDHLPSFPFTEELLENGSLFETEYVIWSNRAENSPLRIERDIEAYALSAYVLNRYDIHEGLFTKFHQTQAQSETYLTDMEILEYDVLYGPHESYDGELPFTATELQFGIDKIKIAKILPRNNSDAPFLYVSGDNFTPYSVAYVNDEKCATTYLNPHLLSVSGFDPAEVLTVCVAQIGKDSQPLSFTEPVTVLDTNK